MAKSIRKSVEIKEPDIWRPLADFLTDMIAKYADEMEFEKLPDPDWYILYRSMKESYSRYTIDRNKRLGKYISLEYVCGM